MSITLLSLLPTINKHGIVNEQKNITPSNFIGKLVGFPGDQRSYYNIGKIILKVSTTSLTKLDILFLLSSIP